MKTIKARILLINITVSLLLCVVIAWLAYAVSANFKAYRLSDLDGGVNTLFGYAEDRIGDYERSAAALAGLGRVYHRLYLDSEEMYSSLIADSMDFGADFIGGGIWYEPYAVFPDKDRVCIYIYSKDGEFVTDAAFLDDTYDYHNQAWYTDIKAQLLSGARAAWHEPYVDAAGSAAYMMTAGAGIYDQNGLFIGMATVDIDAYTLYNIITEADIPSAAYLSAVFANTGSIIKTTGVYPGSADTVKYEKLFGNGVLLTLSVSERDLFAGLNQRLIYITVITAVFIFALFTGVYTVLDRYLNRPITALAKKAKEIGKGRLETAADESGGGEIGELARAINKMTGDIKLYIDDLNKATKENERISAELGIAGKIQRGMLPALDFHSGGFEIYAEMTPCREVGGDFYDAFLLRDKYLCTVIADVAGKGVPAALFMATAKTVLKSFAVTGSSPSEIITRANAQLAADNLERMFVTAFFGILDTETGVYTYVNAGHTAPVIMRAGQPGEYIKTRPNLVLALMGHVEYEENTVRLHRGDAVFLYTDGVTEAVNKDGEVFGAKRLLNTLNDNRDKDLSSIIPGVKRGLDRFSGGEPPFDDVTMLCFGYKGINRAAGVRKIYC